MGTTKRKYRTRRQCRHWDASTGVCKPYRTWCYGVCEEYKEHKPKAKKEGAKDE